MSLQNLMEISEQKTFHDSENIGVITEERIKAQLPHLRNLIAFYREYPDLLIDLMNGPKSTFHFYMYQRIMLRTAMRHRYTYYVFPRGYSKSFLSVLCLMLRCILYPNSKLFVTTGGKEQAASITISKVEELCRLIPQLGLEINWERGASKKSKDDVQYIFKNGSVLDILPARESSRGQRRTGRIKNFFLLWNQDYFNKSKNVFN